jgi:undecaprenyl-diphosphatase
VPALFNWPDQGLAFDVGLHLGTLLALLAYFWRDWWLMGTAGLRDFSRHAFRFSNHSQESRLLWLLALGSVPAAVVGLLFNDWIEENLRQPWLVALALAAFGVVMFVADRRTRMTRRVESVGVADAVIIGIAQSFALFPGISRSGATMSAGLFRDMTREAAARFAFLLGTPAFVGAALVKSGDLSSMSGAEGREMLLGFAFSAVTGFAVVHYLLRFLRTRTLMPFVWYRFSVAALALVIGGIRVS